MTRSRIALIAAVAALPATAYAVPTGISYSLGIGKHGGGFVVGGADILKNAVAPSKLKCTKKKVVIPKAIPIKAQGSFATFRYSGKIKGQKGKVVFAGRFHNGPGEKVTGTTKVTRGKCSSKSSWSGSPEG